MSSGDNVVPAATETVSVLLVDDHDVLRTGCRALFGREPRIRLVGEARNADEALAAARRLKPRIVVVDIRLGRGQSGIGLTKDLLADAALRPIDVVIFTAYGSWRKAERAGAISYVHKLAAEQELVKAVLSSARGVSHVSEAADTADFDPSPWLYVFDGCELDEAGGSLTVDGETRDVPLGVFRFIAYLLKRRAGTQEGAGDGRIVPYEELEAEFSITRDNRRKYVQAARELLRPKRVIVTKKFRGCGIAPQVTLQKRL
jgi:ActR/RegA family two-component response regulator